MFRCWAENAGQACNFCDCLRDNLIRDRIVLGIKDEQTTKKLLRIRDFTLNRCIDISRSEEVTALHMKSLSEPVDYINQVKSKEKKPRVLTPDGQSGQKISCKFCGYENVPERKKCPAWGKVCKQCKKKNHFAKGCKDAVVNAFESHEHLEEISVVRVQATKDKAVFAQMLVQQKPVRFQIDCGAIANIVPCKHVKGVELEPCSQSLTCGMAPRSSLLGRVLCPLSIPELIQGIK